MEDDELKKLLLSNEATLVEVREYLAKIHKQMVWEHVLSVVKILLIVAPIIYSFYFLGPLLKNLLSTYQGLGKTINSVDSLDQQDRPDDASGNMPREVQGSPSQAGQESLQDIIKRLNIGR